MGIMKEFSKDVYGLLETSYSPIDRGCLSYTFYRVIAYYLDDAKGRAGASHGGDRPVYSERTFNNCSSPLSF